VNLACPGLTGPPLLLLARIVNWKQSTPDFSLSTPSPTVTSYGDLPTFSPLSSILTV